jgi:hypothetical protein
VLTYTIDFSDTPLMTDMPTSELTLMGKDYYVLSNSSSTLTLLDSAEDVVLAEGESSSVNGKSVSIEFIGDNSVKLAVDGEVTNSLSEGQTYKLKDGSYVGIKEVLYTSKDSGVSKVEFSVGSGKLTLASGQEVQINEDNIPGLIATITNGGDNTLEDIRIAWSADEDLFITETSELVMPGFGAVKLSFGGLTYPAEEEITVQQGSSTYAVLDNFPLKDGPADINILYGSNGDFTGLGKDSDNRLVTTVGSRLTFDGDTDDYFVASWSDGSDAESYLMRATNFVLDGSYNKTDFQYYKDGAWVAAKSGAKATDEFSLGNVELQVEQVNRTEKNVIFTADNTGVNFTTLYSAEGMKVYLPYLAAENSTAIGAINLTSLRVITAGHANQTFYLQMVEEDKDENKASGDWINLTIGWDNSATKEVEVSAVAGGQVSGGAIEIGETNVFRDFTYSALATEILYDQPTSGQKSVKLMYHGEEVEAAVYITSSDAVVSNSGSSTLGDVLVMDTEVSSVSSKNLIIVGGSCINSAAATVLGGAYCGAAFTDATGVGSGQFLIQGFDGAISTGKLALVVAGYDAADTVNAATYLKTQTVDTAKKYVGTSATSAEMVVDTA